MDAPALRRRRRTRPRWRPASAPRSSWPRCRTCCGCARPDRDTVLYPAVSYPTYEMGATLAGLPRRAGAGRRAWHLDLDAIDRRRRRRARCACGSTRRATRPAALDDLDAAARRGAARTACRCSATSATSSSPGTGRGRTILGRPDGVLAVHSLSKRSNLAGMRVGFYAGDAELVDYLREVRKHAGFMVPGPGAGGRRRRPRRRRRTSTSSATRYRRRLERLAEVLARVAGIDAPLPAGGFYLWLPAPGGDGWALRRPAGRRGRGARAPRASSTAPPAPATSAWPWCSPTTASSWWRRASGRPDGPSSPEGGGVSRPVRLAFRAMADLRSTDRGALGRGATARPPATSPPATWCTRRSTCSTGARPGRRGRRPTRSSCTSG